MLAPHMRVAILSVALVLAAACAKKKPGKLVPDKEIDELLARTTERLKKSAAMNCPRPVLRGQASAGSATDKLTRLAVAEGSLARCKALLSDRDANESTYLACKPISGPRSQRCTVRPFKAKPKTTTEFQSCVATYVEAVESAVQHGDACSPNAREKPAEPIWADLTPIGQAMTAEAWTRVAAGKAASALEIAFDSIRIGQDFARGESGFIEAMLSASGLDWARLITVALVSRSKFSKEEIARFIVEADALIATDVSFASVIRGERIQALLEIGVRPLQSLKSGGPPPPGTDENLSPDEVIATYAITALAAEASLDALDTTCPLSADLRTCAEGLEKRREMLDAKFASFKGKSVTEYLLSGSVEAEIREALVGILETTLTGSDEKYLLKYGIRIVELAAIRLELELARLTLTSAGCPTLEAFTRATTGLRSPKALGGAISIDERDGFFLVLPPKWLIDRTGALPRPISIKTIRLECPRSATDE